MKDKVYQLRYLPLFEQDMIEIVDYISNTLKNPAAADRLVNDVEAAILDRLNNPLSFEPYPSSRERKYPYYRIYVRNYTVFYIVIDNCIEVRRIIYNARDIDHHL